ncbi:MAG: GMC family oxidoreductase N-terminal domain-containing protein, partial [Pseudomonadota bacterium]
KTLGGSSSINGLLYIRGHRSDYDHWRQLGNTGWSYDDVLPYFRKSENQERGADDFHGKGGGLSVSNIRVHRELCDRFIDGGVELGLPRTDDFNGAKQEGVGYFQLTTKHGRRCSSAVAFLNPARGRANLEIVTKAQAQRLVIKDGQVCGVIYRKGGEDFTVTARREVVLASGAIGSPQLLMVSGIGPGAHLSDFGIDVVGDLSGVGKNMQDHLQTRMVFKTKKPITLNDQVNHPVKKVLMGIEYMLKRTGPLTMGASQVCAFVRTRPDLIAPDIQFHVQPLSADKPGDGAHKFSAFTSSTCQLRPESRGEILLKSPDPMVYPALHPNYLSTQLDCETQVEGMKWSRRLAATRALEPLISDEHLPGRHIQTDEELLQAARDISQTIYHPTSTCKMGNDPASVVDERLRVHGVAGLRVADASIMPTIVSGNTNAPTIMIGEKASAMMLDDAKAAA